MADDAGSWIGVLQWALSNPEKGALLLVVLAGAWRYVRELRSDLKADADRESFTDILIRENKELRAELREERRKGNRPASDENSETPHD